MHSLSLSLIQAGGLRGVIPEGGHPAYAALVDRAIEVPVHGNMRPCTGVVRCREGLLLKVLLKVLPLSRHAPGRRVARYRPPAAPARWTLRAPAPPKILLDRLQQISREHRADVHRHIVSGYFDLGTDRRLCCVNWIGLYSRIIRPLQGSAARAHRVYAARDQARPVLGFLEGVRDVAFW